MMDEATAVLQAVNLLNSPGADAVSRRNADQWLQAWRSSPNAWKTCLILVQPALPLGDGDRYFFACALRFACSRFCGDILHPSLLGDFLDQTALALLASTWRGSSAVSGQLASAIAALAIRSPAWEPSRLLPDLAALFQRHAPSLQAWVQQQSQQQQQQGIPPATAAVPVDHAPLAALMQVLRFTAAEARGKQVRITTMQDAWDPPEGLCTATSAVTLLEFSLQVYYQVCLFLK